MPREFLMNFKEIGNATDQPVVQATAEWFLQEKSMAGRA